MKMLAPRELVLVIKVILGHLLLHVDQQLRSQLQTDLDSQFSDTVVPEVGVMGLSSRSRGW